MRVLMAWGRDMDGDGFKELVKELGIEYCAYFGDAKKPDVSNSECKMEKLPIYSETIYDGWGYCKSGIESSRPLDSSTINIMKDFELMAIEVIYRWRRTLTSDYSIGNIKRIYYDYLRFWDNFLVSKNIDCVILPNIPHIPTFYLCYAICKARGIPVVLRFILPKLIGWPQCEYFTTSIEEVGIKFEHKLSNNKKIYRDEEGKDIILPAFFDIYFSNYSNESFGSKTAIIEQDPYNLFLKLNRYLKRGVLYIKRAELSILYRKIIYIFNVKFLSKKILNHAEKLEETPSFEEVFVYFPLHYQPEGSTLPLAGIYVSQFLMIETLAASLPEGVKLYVKEHPVFWIMNDRTESVAEARSMDFYDRIVALKNVTLIPHTLSSSVILDKCACVATASGSIGWEALFKGISVLAFGNPYYKYCEQVYLVRGVSECQEALKNILFKEEKKRNTRDLKLFLKTMEKITMITGAGDSDLLEANKALLNEPLDVYQAQKIGEFVKEVIYECKER